MFITRTVTGGLALALLAGCAGAAPPETTQSATAPPATAPPAAGPAACSPDVRIDGFDDGLDGTEFRDVYVGNLSALAVAPDGTIEALSDRSALFTLDPRSLRPTAVVALRDERGGPLDAEGLVIEPDGTRLVASETGPAVRRYRSDGTLLGSLRVPDDLRAWSARNQTFEGLTALPDGTLVASMEGPLDDERTVRFQTWVGGAPAAGHDYPVDAGFGVADIAALDPRRLLVVERAYLPRVGNGVHLYLAELGARPMTKTLLADLGRCPTLGATAQQPQANPLLDNIEGMAVTGRDPDGTLHLLLVSDDNQRPAQTTRLYRFTARPPR